MSIAFVLAVVAIVLAIIQLARTELRDLTAWAVICLALIFLLPGLR